VINNNTYPLVLEQISNQLAIVRSELSKNIYAENTGGYRGERENEISNMGILAELVAWHIINESNVLFNSAPLLEIPINNVLKHSTAPDVTLEDGTTIDIKATKSLNELYVNHSAHNNKSKRPDWYWFIKCDNGTATSIKFNSNEVDTWEIKESTFTPVYYKRLEATKHINQ